MFVLYGYKEGMAQNCYQLLKFCFMNEQQGTQNNKHQENKHAGAEQGRQGVDKMPGEETPTEPVQFEQEAFKGKKVDADPTQESDRPASQDDL